MASFITLRLFGSTSPTAIMLIDETTLPQLIAGLAAGDYEVGRTNISWSGVPTSVIGRQPGYSAGLAFRDGVAVAEVGSVLTADDGDTGAGTITREHLNGTTVLGTGATLTITEAMSGGTLQLKVLNNGSPFFSPTYPIRYAPPFASVPLVETAITTGVGTTTIDASPAFAGGGKVTLYELISPPAFAAIDANTGVITIDNRHLLRLSDRRLQRVEGFRAAAQRPLGFLAAGVEAPPGAGHVEHGLAVIGLGEALQRDIVLILVAPEVRLCVGDHRLDQRPIMGLRLRQGGGRGREVRAGIRDGRRRAGRYRSRKRRSLDRCQRRVFGSKSARLTRRRGGRKADLAIELILWEVGIEFPVQRIGQLRVAQILILRELLANILDGQVSHDQRNPSGSLSGAPGAVFMPSGSVTSLRP